MTGHDDSGFRFSLTDEEKTYLMDLARLSILRCHCGGDDVAGGGSPPPSSQTLQAHLGAFVTLKIKGCLRGCIGHVVGDRPVYETVYAMARQAAFHDPRFMPLTAAEAEELGIDISILSPLTPCPDPARIEPGRHGLLVVRGNCSGLLLPQVATEYGWDRETFLAQTCRKAGLPPDCWRDPSATCIYWFEAVVF